MRRLVIGLSLVVPAVFSAIGAEPAGVAHALPTGFTDEFVGSFSRPTAVEQLPNDRIVVLEQHTGRVRLVDTNTGVTLPGAALQVNVCSNANERGLLGFTEDPDFPVNGRVYLFYTTPIGGTCVNRVSAFTMIGDTILPSSEQVLIDNISSVNSNHNGGDLEVGNDGFLYVGTGDAGRDPRGDSGSAGGNDAAQDRSLLNGKILRLDRFSGLPAPGNPLSGPGTTVCGSRGNTAATPVTQCQEIFAWGLRNAYRFAFDPNTGATRFYINDVGQNTQEEINEGILGANYGWNTREGNCPRGQVPPCAGPPAGLTDPIEAYTHSRGTYITAGAFVPNGGWPAEYDGGYFFADGGSGRVWLKPASGAVDYDDPFLTNKFGLADMAFVLEPDGWSLFYTLNGSGQLRKITVDLPASSASAPLSFERLSATSRAFDSRQGPDAARIRGGQTRLIDLGPEAVGAEAALVNITVAGPAGSSFATVWEPRTQRPSTSNVNALLGEVVANASIVPVDDQGRMMLYTRATSHVIVDVTGVFREVGGPVTGGRLEPTTPLRIVDTRLPTGPDNDYDRGTSGGGELVQVPVAGRAGIPMDGAGSVVVALTGLAAPDQAGAGFLTAFEGNTSLPEASNVNVNPNGDARVNTAVVPLGSDGSIDVFLFDVDDVLIDVVGYMTDADAPSSESGRFRLLAPTREADTRSGLAFGPLGDGDVGVLNPASVPDGAGAIAHNLTFAPSQGWGFITPFPGPDVPTVSNLNATQGGQTRAAMALTPMASDGTVRFFSGLPFSDGGHELVVDVFGYFE